MYYKFPKVAAEVRTLLGSIEHRDLVGQAKGILMERYKITAEEAFDRLHTLATEANRAMVDIARDVVASGIC